MFALLKFVPLLFSLLSGYKTYIGVGVYLASIVLNKLGFAVPGMAPNDPNWFQHTLEALLFATTRAGIAKVTK